MKLIYFHLSLFMIIIAFPNLAGASEIGSGSKAKKAHDLHETYTRLAEFCLTRNIEQPKNCVDLFPHIRSYMRTAITSHRGEIAHAARWPDDPTRKLDTSPSKLNFGLQMFDKCNRSLDWGDGINNVGLLCSSHYGKLQFFHAQASIEDTNQAETRTKILSWAKFAFRVATDPSFADADYCKTIAGLGSDDHGLKDALTFSDRTFCESHGKRNKFPAWKIKTLFSFQCSNPFSSKGCTDLSIVQDPAIASRAATGALLHLVQDSYSQSHTARVVGGRNAPSPKGPFKPLIACEPISVFYNYRDQDDSHADADAPPAIDTSCFMDDRKVDDLITASANILWIIATTTNENRMAKQADLIDYLQSRVFLTKDSPVV